jgi:hypothetical protein
LNGYSIHRTAIVLSCGLLLVAGAACSSSGGNDAAQQQPTTTVKKHPAKHPTHPAGSTTTRPAGPTTIAGPPPPQLADLILANGPAGFVRQSDDLGDTGPTNLAKASDDDNSADARDALLSAGFTDGYQRLWTNVDASGSTLDQDYLFLYRFATPEGAQAWMQHWRETLLTTNGKTAVQPFTPELIPGAVGLAANTPKQGSTGVVLFTKGQYAVQALVVGGPNVDQSVGADDIAYAQYQQLP